MTEEKKNSAQAAPKKKKGLSEKLEKAGDIASAIPTSGEDVAKGAIAGGLKGASDATFRMGKLKKGSEDDELRMRKELQKAMLAWLGSLVLILLPVGFLSGNFVLGFGACLFAVGFYNIITGRAVLKGGPAQHSVFLGWKARLVGVFLIAVSVVVILIGSNPA